MIHLRIELTSYKIAYEYIFTNVYIAAFLHKVRELLTRNIWSTLSCLVAEKTRKQREKKKNLGDSFHEGSITGRTT